MLLPGDDEFIGAAGVEVDRHDALAVRETILDQGPGVAIIGADIKAGALGIVGDVGVGAGEELTWRVRVESDGNDPFIDGQGQVSGLPGLPAVVGLVNVVRRVVVDLYEDVVRVGGIDRQGPAAAWDLPGEGLYPGLPSVLTPEHIMLLGGVDDIRVRLGELDFPHEGVVIVIEAKDLLPGIPPDSALVEPVVPEGNDDVLVGVVDGDIPDPIVREVFI